MAFSIEVLALGPFWNLEISALKLRCITLLSHMSKYHLLHSEYGDGCHNIVVLLFELLNFCIASLQSKITVLNFHVTNRCLLSLVFLYRT